ncbi:hypothetical protein M5K25_027693 [Dendrobium thyrsiflorum]|uniref:Uncharacterized protein n=1 Tax=Dendrobium thyrsiflorum TaxID=117978 RepID=A0ABD0TUM7_DENTH
MATNYDFQNQFSTIHEKIDGRFAALEDLMKKMNEDKQKPATSETTGGPGRGGNPNPFRGRENPKVEVLEGDYGMPPLELLSTEEMSMGYDRRGADFVIAEVLNLKGEGKKFSVVVLILKGEWRNFITGGLILKGEEENTKKGSGFVAWAFGVAGDLESCSSSRIEEHCINTFLN